MTSPPANQRKWLPGYEGVGCKLETDPIRIAVLCREATWGSVFDMVDNLTDEIIASALGEIEGGKVLGAAFEVPALAFIMRGSRSTMDQLLRLRESAGASHTTRDNDFRDFNIIVPSTIEALAFTGDGDDGELYSDLSRHIDATRKLYGRMVDRGIPPQDARYLCLPMGYQGDWIQVMNMRALIKECEQRLCNGLTQHESNYMVRLQRDLVVERWPHMDKLLRSGCEKRGACTQGTMLFPPCGAFGEGRSEDLDAMTISQYCYKHDPEKYLYPPDQNDAMQFAQWDRDRKHMEADGMERPIPFSEDPDLLT